MLDKDYVKLCTFGKLFYQLKADLIHWARVTHMCVSKLTIIASDNALSPGRRQTIIWTNDGIMLIRTLGTYFSEILIEIMIFLLKKMRLKVSSAKWRPCCLGLNVLTSYTASLSMNRTKRQHIVIFFFFIKINNTYVKGRTLAGVDVGPFSVSYWAKPLLMTTRHILSEEFNKSTVVSNVILLSLW